MQEQKGCICGRGLERGDVRGMDGGLWKSSLKGSVEYAAEHILSSNILDVGSIGGHTGSVHRFWKWRVGGGKWRRGRRVEGVRRGNEGRTLSQDGGGQRRTGEEGWGAGDESRFQVHVDSDRQLKVC